MAVQTDSPVLDSIVLTIIYRRLQADQPCGIRALVDDCQLADKTISKAITRLEDGGRLRVTRGEPGTRHEYEIINPPTVRERIITRAHLGEPLEE